jgi:broad specificity phosphatase PhoE
VKPRWTGGPTGLTLVRHGHSIGNEADSKAREAGAEVLDLEQRDADVELSKTGQEQAAAVGAWLDELDDDHRPTVVISSPYLRAAQTARTAVERLGVDVEYDERLRERDLGIFDGLTGAGIRARHPEEAERRNKLGKFYYQPPSGESWADVVLRARSLLSDLRHGYDDSRVYLFTHQAVIMSFRYALEGLSEEEILQVDREVQIPNASVTTYQRDGEHLELVTFADTVTVDRTDADVTEQEDQGGSGGDDV